MMASVGDGGDDEDEGRGDWKRAGVAWTGGMRAGRRSGRDSRPRFADAKGDANSDRN